MLREQQNFLTPCFFFVVVVVARTQKDHVGVSNAQLVKEGVDIATQYKGRSVAEQNSLDLSWGLLMQSRFDELRSLLLPTPEDEIRFRQLVVNVSDTLWPSLAVFFISSIMK